jgi:hypothetical protein
MGVSATLARPHGRESQHQQSAAVVKVFTSIRLSVQLVLAAAVVCSIAVQYSGSSSGNLCGSCGVLFKAAAAVLPSPVASAHLPPTLPLGGRADIKSPAAVAADDHSSSSWSKQQPWLVMQLLLHSLVSTAVYQVSDGC